MKSLSVTIFSFSNLPAVILQVVCCGSDCKSPDCPNQCTDAPKCAFGSGIHPVSVAVNKDLLRIKKPNTKSNLL